MIQHESRESFFWRHLGAKFFIFFSAHICWKMATFCLFSLHVTCCMLYILCIYSCVRCVCAICMFRSVRCEFVTYVLYVCKTAQKSFRRQSALASHSCQCRQRWHGTLTMQWRFQTILEIHIYSHIFAYATAPSMSATMHIVCYIHS